MKTGSEKSFLKEKTSMPTGLAINTFVINLPVNGQVISVTLCLFCRNSFHPGRKNNSYSIVGKISGLKCDAAAADVLADYGTGNILKDHLPVISNQFIYSNYSTKPVALSIKVHVKGMLHWYGVIEASVNIKLMYNLKRLTINDVKSEYRLKNVPESKLVLMQ